MVERVLAPGYERAGMSSPTVSVRAPDHLGDGVLALGAVRALAAAHPTVVHAPAWGAELYAGLRVAPVDAPPTGAVAVILKPSVAAAWRWRAVPRRIGVGRRSWLTDPVEPRPGEHRRDTTRRVALALLGAAPPWDDTFRARGVPAPLPDEAWVLLAWGNTPAARWPGFRALADRAPRPAVFVAGPGEGDALRALAGPHPVLEVPRLADLAATLDLAGRVVANDTGLGHFAVACGARVLTVHGSTDPAITGSGVPVMAEAPPWCAPCWRKTCPFDLDCLRAVSVDAVLAALEAS